MHPRREVIIFLGPPGSGKGTQAARLSTALGRPAISTGDLLRRESESGTALGAMLQKVLASGQLAGDELMNNIIVTRMMQKDCESGCILDGYPRTEAQARFLDELLDGWQAPEARVFDFGVSAEEVIARLGRRRQCPRCGRIYSVKGVDEATPVFCDNDRSVLVARADDCPTAIRERLRIYERNAGKLVHYYRNRDYHRVAAGRTPDEIADELLRVLALYTTRSAAMGEGTFHAQSAC